MKDKLIRKPFTSKNLDENRKNKPPLPVKLNDRDEEMLAIGRYAFNKDSKSGVLKDLAEMGLKVLLDQFGVEKMHKLTNPRRRLLVQEKPNYVHFKEN